MKRIPYGQSNYKNLVENNYIYIDKTPYLEKLEAYDSRNSESDFQFND